MYKNPLFSVITVTRENLAGLKQTHNTLQSQNTDNFQWVVIDGAGRDGTGEWLEKTEALWISEPDQGPYDAMNKGLECAKGEYVLFLNAGDGLTGPEILEKLAEIVKMHNPDFIYGDSLETLPGGENVYKPARACKKIKTGMFTHHQAMFYRREKIGKLRFNTAYKIAADYDFTARFLKRAERVSYAPFPLCLFESGGLSQQRAVHGRNEQFLIRKKLGLSGLLENTATYAAQSALWEIRRRAPLAYWRIKSGGHRRSASGQT